jgi:putative endonuclease
MDRSSRQRRRRCSTISRNQIRCASPAATAHHLRLVPISSGGARRQIAVRTYLTRETFCSGLWISAGAGARYNRRVHYVYIVRCADGTLYTGYARDPRARERAHNTGRGAKYTAGRRPVRLVYQEAFRSVGKALAREYVVKQLTRAQKDALVVSGRRRH